MIWDGDSTMTWVGDSTMTWDGDSTMTWIIDSTLTWDGDSTGSFLPKRTQVSACPTPISPKLILWVGGSCDMTKCKGHPLEVFCCGDIIGYFCDLFLGHYVFDTLYLMYLSTLINEFSMK